MKKVTVFFLIIIILPLLYASLPLRKVFPQIDNKYFEMFKEGTTFSGSTLEDGIMHIIPKGTLIYGCADESSKRTNSFSVCISSFIPFDEALKEMTDEQQMLKLFNIVTAMSGQKGITYISKTAGNKRKVLIEDSYCISDLDNKKSKINDPVFTYLPENYSLFTYQKDNRFSGNTFTVDYKTTSDEILMKINNHTPMKFMGITCVPKEQLSMYISVYRVDEGVVISCIAEIFDKKPTVNLLFYTVDLQDSFTRRILGIKDWFADSISNT